LFFYSWWNINNLPIILASIIFNYTLGSCLNKTKYKYLLAAGITANLLLIFYYKYFLFFISNLNHVFSAHISHSDIILPLGISFFTFTQIAYLVDVYHNEAKEYSFINYVLFVTFFPHLIAGPIIHHKEMMPQFASLRTKVLNWNNISHGLMLFSVGLFKKVIIADTLAKWVDPGFAATSLSLVEAWSAAISYTFQLYFDFSGYTDMALGIALLFNIKLPQNFNAPYKADSIIDFWRRWHMTLSRFLLHYIYIPLGGNRRGKARRYINLLITMFIGGLWHGASWTFVFWGVLHGVGLAINNMWRSLGFKMHWIFGRMLTFLFVVVGWVFFKADTFSQALVVLKGMVNSKDIGIQISQPSLLMPFGRKEILVLIIIYLFVSLYKNSVYWENIFRPNWKWAIFVSAIFVSSILGLNRISQFLYFQF
jgi:D-alanyl-lipoteichoic acid acyltransferase DltB (MBOAT superfamily)